MRRIAVPTAQLKDACASIKGIMLRKSLIRASDGRCHRHALATCHTTYHGRTLQGQ